MQRGITCRHVLYAVLSNLKMRSAPSMDNNLPEEPQQITVRRLQYTTSRTGCLKSSHYHGVTFFSSPPVHEDSKGTTEKKELKRQHLFDSPTFQYSTQGIDATHSVCNPWLSPFERFVNVDLCQGAWKHIWIPGCLSFSICGLPRNVHKVDILRSLKDIPLPFNYSIKTLNLVLLFGDETIAVNPLGPCTYQSPDAETLALAHFSNTDEAQMFWSVCGAGILKIYGHRLSCFPDPTGYRIFGEAVMGNFRYDDLKNVKSCICCQPTHDVVEKAEESKTLTLLLPFVTAEFVKTQLVPIFSKKSCKVEYVIHLCSSFRVPLRDAVDTSRWLRESASALIVLPAQKLPDVCLPQRYQFKMTAEKKTTVQASVFHLGDRVTPCVINPPKLALVSAHTTPKVQHETVDGPRTVSKKRSTPLRPNYSNATPKTGTSTSPDGPRASLTGRRADHSEMKLLQPPVLKRPRGRPRGSAKRHPL